VLLRFEIWRDICALNICFSNKSPRGRWQSF
jgi:hypothetical protein